MARSSIKGGSLYTPAKRKKLMKLFESRSAKYRARSKHVTRKKARGVLERPVPVATVRDVLRVLIGVDYALIGGHAVTIHGHPRNTDDIDLLARSEDVGRIREMLGGIRSRPLTIGGISIKVKGVPVDIVAPRQPWVDPALDTAEKTRYGKVISKPFLVLTKLWAMRGEQDDTDILYVLRAMNSQEKQQTRTLIMRFLPNEAEDLESMLALAALSE
jgi:hypothetical protein